MCNGCCFLITIGTVYALLSIYFFKDVVKTKCTILYLDFFWILYTLLIPFGKFVFVTQRNCVATEQRH